MSTQSKLIVQESISSLVNKIDEEDENVYTQLQKHCHRKMKKGKSQIAINVSAPLKCMLNAK